MRKSLLFLSISLMLFSCDNSTKTIKQAVQESIVPQPKQLLNKGNTLLLSKESKSYSPDETAQKLLQLFDADLQKLSGIGLGTTSRNGANADVIFLIDTSLQKEEYHIDIEKIIHVLGGSYQALKMAESSLIQMVEIEHGLLAFPVLNLIDYPDVAYRGLMLDLARQWHDIATIKQCIDLAAFYKSNYLHLHFSDYQSYTLPSKIFPKLSTDNKTYSFDELTDLENYANTRGISIIPEIDIPGHSSPFVEKYPEIFAIEAIKENPWIVHMGKEDVYQALDTIIGEVCGIFQSTPYFHIGGDEAIFYKVSDDSEVKAYMKKHELGEDVHELYRHFLVRLNNIVKKHQKQMCVWEGFGREGDVIIPKDILVFEFETNRYLPNHLVEDGYQVVNTSWKPLYVVNQKKWEPKTIYNWNIWRWENWFSKAPSFTPIQLDESPLIIGAEMCAWEQPGTSEIPSLRKRLPTMNERIWNTHKQISYELFMSHLNNTDRRLSKIIGNIKQDKLLENYNFIGEAPKD